MLDRMLTYAERKDKGHAMIRADDADEYDLGEVAAELERRANSDTSDAAEATRRLLDLQDDGIL